MAEPPSNRPIGKRETREALIQAGLLELARQGLQEPSLDAICARAGFTRGAFYVHFEDREDFTDAVLERALGGFLDAIIPGGSDAQDLAQAVARFAGSGRAIPLHRLLEACARSPRVRERWAARVREASERTSKTVLEAQVAGSVRGDLEAGQVGALLLSFALGAAAALESGAPFDPARARDAVLAFLSAPPDPKSRRRG
ncbi:MAG TPA: TetR/AcrR family transcriptional regulator [Myxococcota bacterium]|jgi:AcrR family transcriptional regulator